MCPSVKHKKGLAAILAIGTSVWISSSCPTQKKGGSGDGRFFEICDVTLPETNSSPLKRDGWKINLPIGKAYFQGLC